MLLLANVADGDEVSGLDLLVFGLTVVAESTVKVELVAECMDMDCERRAGEVIEDHESERCR